MQRALVTIHTPPRPLPARVEGTIKSGGVFKLLNKQEYTAKTKGQIKDSEFIPKNYVEYRNKKGKKSTASLSYELGIPQIRLYSPPRKTNSETINPETQKGTVDPLTAIYATLADISNGKLCELNLKVFDGKRKSSVKLIPILKERKGLIMCFGEYKRIAGFSKEDMEEKTMSRDGWKKDQCLLYLPEMTEHDLYLDFEGHPFWEIEQGLIFLFGYIEKIGGEWQYVAHWAHDKTEEKKQAGRIIDYFYEKYQQHPQMRIYHYNHTERALLADITKETDSMSSILSVLETTFQDSPPELQRLEVLIEDGVFVDLLAITRNSMQTGFRSFSLKEMEKLAGFRRGQDKNVPHASSEGQNSNNNDQIEKGAGAVFEYELFVNAELYGIPKDEKRLDRIANYNRDDVVATRDLHEWLLDARKNEDKLPDETLSPSTDEETFEPSETQIERERLQELIIKKLKDQRHDL